MSWVYAVILIWIVWVVMLADMLAGLRLMSLLSSSTNLTPSGRVLNILCYACRFYAT